MIENKDSWYNPETDNNAVSQDDYLDLQEAFVNGVVPGSIDFEESPSNGLDALNKVGSVVRDPFQADRAKKALQSKPDSSASPESPASD